MASEMHRRRVIALMRTLIEDVLASRARLNASDSQTARRDVVRASLAAIEGETWLLRDHVRETLVTLEELSPLADLALRETVYTVTDSGKVKEQERSVSLPTAIKLAVDQASIVCSDLAVDFSRRGWSDLKEAIAIRNRITHPKPENGLEVSMAELAVVESGLMWLLGIVEHIMASTNLVLTEIRDITERLLAGDEAALADYKRVLEDRN